MSTTPIGLNSSSNTTNSTTSNSSGSSSSGIANENVFLQLLVAQLKYQDPTQPTDGTQFVSELAQFSDLSNTTNMSSDLDTITGLMQSALSPVSTPTTTPASSAQANQQTNQQQTNSTTNQTSSL